MDMMTVKAPSFGIKAYPHIKSRLKIHSNCNGLNGKPFPQWDMLLRVFGKGCATGEGARAANEGARAANEEAPPAPESECGAIVTRLDNNTPLDQEAMASFMDKVINKVVDMTTPTGDRNEQPSNSRNNVVVGGDNFVGARQRTPAARRIELEILESVMTNEISEIRPAIQQAIDGMVNRLLEEDDDSTMMCYNIIADLEDILGLTRYQVIDAASTLPRDENRHDL
ncbi:hypothetical protein LINPERPRIM_LOCUS35283 [Linum perenne]